MSTNLTGALSSLQAFYSIENWICSTWTFSSSFCVFFFFLKMKKREIDKLIFPQTQKRNFSFFFFKSIFILLLFLLFKLSTRIWLDTLDPLTFAIFLHFIIHVHVFIIWFEYFVAWWHRKRVKIIPSHLNIHTFSKHKIIEIKNANFRQKQNANSSISLFIFHFIQVIFIRVSEQQSTIFFQNQKA